MISSCSTVPYIYSKCLRTSLPCPFQHTTSNEWWSHFPNVLHIPTFSYTSTKLLLAKTLVLQHFKLPLHESTRTFHMLVNKLMHCTSNQNQIYQNLFPFDVFVGGAPLLLNSIFILLPYAMVLIKNMLLEGHFILCQHFIKIRRFHIIGFMWLGSTMMMNRIANWHCFKFPLSFSSIQCL